MNQAVVLAMILTVLSLQPRAVREPTSRATEGQDDAWTSEEYELKLLSVHQPDGEPIPIDTPRPGAQFDPEFLALTPEQALTRMRALATTPTTSTANTWVGDRAKEITTLHDLSADLDPGGLVFLQALVPVIRELAAHGRDPLDSGWHQPRHPTSGFVAGPVHPAMSLLRTPLTQESCRLLETTFRSYFTRAIDSHDAGAAFPEPPRKQPWMTDSFFVLLMRHMLASGHASSEFTHWYTEHAVTDLVHRLQKLPSKRICVTRQLRLLANYGALQTRHVTQLGNAAMECLFDTATSGRQAQEEECVELAVEVLEELAALPGMEPEQARCILSLLSAYVELNSDSLGRTRNTSRRMLSRYDVQTLFGEDAVPNHIAGYLDDVLGARGKARFTPDSVQPVHVRVSAWRVRPRQPATHIATRTFTAARSVWHMQCWGDPVSFGSVSVLPGVDYIRWDYHFGDTDFSSMFLMNCGGEIERDELNGGPICRPIRRVVSVTPADAISDRYAAATLDVHVVEFGAEPLASTALEPRDVIGFLLEEPDRDFRWCEAIFDWMKARPEAFVPELMVEICKRGDTSENVTVRAAADVLTSRGDWQAFDRLIPHLLDRPDSMVPPPVFDAFEVVADEPNVPVLERQRWAREMIKTHLSESLHPLNLYRLLRLSEKLSGEAFGFDSEKPIGANAMAIRAAQEWASR